MKRILLATLCFALFASAAMAAHGVFTGALPAADTTARHFTLVLRDDGTASLRTVYAGRGAVTDRGHWSQGGGRVVLQLDRSAPIVWYVRPGSLQPATWSRSDWGRGGPPVLVRR